MATVNIYVSDDLKAAMAEHELNWSQVAAKAFETAITLERTKNMPPSATASTRLRVSRDQAIDRRMAQGHGIGQQWAQDNAEYDELDRVAALDLEPGMDPEDAAFALMRAYWDDERPDRSDVREGMERLFGREAPTTAEILGFVEGAAEVFNQIDD